MTALSDLSTRPCRRLAALVLALAALLSAGCSTIYVQDLPTAETLPLADAPPSPDEPGVAPYRIQAGDELDIKFFYTRELNETLKVRPDGYITLQLIDDVRAAGLTPSELKAALTERYAAHLKTPVLSVIMRTFPSYRAYVGGEVGVPQLVSLEGGLTPMQALMRAGGVRNTADLQSVVLIRKGPKGEPVPYRLNLSDDAVTSAQRDVRIAMQPSDVLYVPRTRIANANLFVQQYIADLLLFRGVQLGFTTNYIYNRDRKDGDATVVP